MNLDFFSQVNLKLQPVFDISIGKVFGYESLLRLNDPLFGEFCPSEFLPKIKDTATKSALENVTLNQFSKIAKAFRQKYKNVTMISVNITSEMFWHDDFVDMLVRGLGDGYDCNNIYLEIKASALSNPVAKQNIIDIKALGIKIIADGFLGAHSEYLAYGMDFIKLSNQLVSGVHNDVKKRSEISNIFKLAKALNLSVIAVGIEREEEEKIIKSIGINYAQGFYYCAPKPISKFISYEEINTIFNTDQIEVKHPSQANWQKFNKSFYDK